MHHWTPGLPATAHEGALQLLEEISTLERRLADMGLDGDCAYERAMCRLYTGMVEDRKQLLAGLRQAPEY